MPTATLIVAVDDAAEVAAVDAWFDVWCSQLALVSENEGCGCCVGIWRIEASIEAIDALPPSVRGG